MEMDELMVRLNANLKCGVDSIFAIATRLADIQIECGVCISAEDFISQNLHFGLTEVVYEWASGTSFKQITDLTEVLEGSIVRCITRLDELCREVRDAARVIGNAALYQKMESASAAIKRDIVFAASLYT
jgi:antiviral helicase SKI2